MAKTNLEVFSIPEDFIDTFNSSMDLVDKDPRFKEGLKNIPKRYNKKNKHNKLKSLKFRYIMGYYFKKRREEIKKGENVTKPKDSNSEKSPIR